MGDWFEERAQNYIETLHRGAIFSKGEKIADTKILAQFAREADARARDDCKRFLCEKCAEGLPFAKDFPDSHVGEAGILTECKAAAIERSKNDV